MVLFFAHKSKRDAKFGMTKLAKQMFYADFNAFRVLGQSISGLDYKKLPHGPVPTQAKAIHQHLLDTGQAVERAGTFGRKQLIPEGKFSRKHFESVFTEGELKIMEWAYELTRTMKAHEVSDLSHSFVGWRVAANEEVIPYGASLIDERNITQSERDYGLDLIDKLGHG